MSRPGKQDGSMPCIYAPRPQGQSIYGHSIRHSFCSLFSLLIEIHHDCSGELCFEEIGFHGMLWKYLGMEMQSCEMKRVRKCMKPNWTKLGRGWGGVGWGGGFLRLVWKTFGFLKFLESNGISKLEFFGNCPQRGRQPTNGTDGQVKSLRSWDGASKNDLLWKKYKRFFTSIFNCFIEKIRSWLRVNAVYVSENVTTQVGFKSRFWLHCHFSFFDFKFLRITFENLKCAIGVEIIFLFNWIFRIRLYNTRNKSIQNIVILKFFLPCILLSLMFEIPLKHNSYLNLQLDRNINSPPIAHFKFWNVVLRNKK